MPPAQSPYLPGDIVAGKYRVDRQIGAGGMGVVLAATHLDLLETRALKFLSEAALEDAESVERFLREARAASRLKSEHVARVFDVGRLPTGMPFMVMEYLEGADLGAMLKSSARLSVPVAVNYVLQAMEGLAEAHAAGIVHRDLKPANLFLTFRPDGTECVKVLDFGISKIKSGNAEDIDVTKTHAVLGSPHYMSPEQMESSRDVDARSDVWSLGILLYQLMTGELPFKGRTMTEVVAVVFSKPPVPPSKIVEDIPAALEKAILRCLQHDVNARPQNVGELAKEIEPFAPPGNAQVVERIMRLLQTPVVLRLSSSNPIAVPQIMEAIAAVRKTGGAPGAVSQDAPITLPNASAEGQAPGVVAPTAGWSERANEITLQQPNSASGAWGATASGSKRRRIPAAAILLACGAMLLGVAVAIAIVTSKSPAQGEPSANSAVAMESSTARDVVSAAPIAESSAVSETIESAAPSVSASSATKSKPRSTGRTKSPPPPGTGTTKDPFGMDRK